MALSSPAVAAARRAAGTAVAEKETSAVAKKKTSARGKKTSSTRGKRRLVVVESPSKARTIEKILGRDEYTVMASAGHVLELCPSSKLPATMRTNYLKRFSIDVPNGFRPCFSIMDRSIATISRLKEALKESTELILATDDDREGEAIAAHLLEILKPNVGVSRIVFHEITSGAIHEALKRSRDVRRDLCQAQEARVVLDRLYGFALSPAVTRHSKELRSAGRVQSPATRLLVQRERLKRNFKAAAFWNIKAGFAGKPPSGGVVVEANLESLSSNKVAKAQHFGPDGLPKGKAVVLDEAAASSLVAALSAPGVEAKVVKLETATMSTAPDLPFITTTLQCEAASRLGLTSEETMKLAQGLYEQGLITYMRTDNPTLSKLAIKAARQAAREEFGDDSVPSTARAQRKSKKVLNAQEAHEAIRPAGDGVWRRPEALKSQLDKKTWKLYELIWKRAVSSQMVNAERSQVKAIIEVDVVIKGPGNKSSKPKPKVARFVATASAQTSPGFRAAWQKEKAVAGGGGGDPLGQLAFLREGATLSVVGASSQERETSPPKGYTEASLIKELEVLGIGRPSTYASVVPKILSRKYASRKGGPAGDLEPTDLGFKIVELLEGSFGHLVEYNFTAKVEADLDRIAQGQLGRVAFLNAFYLGNETLMGLEPLVENFTAMLPRAVRRTSQS